MTAPGTLVREARIAAGLTQSELADRLGTSQPVVARMERSSASPRFDTIDRALRATGHRLRLSLEPHTTSVDESLIRKHLELAPAQRVKGLESMYEEARSIALAGERARGQLA